MTVGGKTGDEWFQKENPPARNIGTMEKVACRWGAKMQVGRKNEGEGVRTSKL